MGGAPRGNFGQGPGFGGRGGFGGGYGGGPGMGGRSQIFVSNVSSALRTERELQLKILTASLQRRLAGPQGPLPSGW